MHLHDKVEVYDNPYTHLNRLRVVFFVFRLTVTSIFCFMLVFLACIAIVYLTVFHHFDNSNKIQVMSLSRLREKLP